MQLPPGCGRAWAQLQLESSAPAGAGMRCKQPVVEGQEIGTTTVRPAAWQPDVLCKAMQGRETLAIRGRTVQPASEAMGAYFLLMDPPALNRAMSTPSKLHRQK
jgi:hypothetical protein